MKSYTNFFPGYIIIYIISLIPIVCSYKKSSKNRYYIYIIIAVVYIEWICFLSYNLCKLLVMDTKILIGCVRQ